MRKSLVGALAYVLTGVMTVSTPMTASAMGISEIFSTTETESTNSATVTTTTTNTNTNTNGIGGDEFEETEEEILATSTKTLTDDEDAEVIDITLNKATVNLEVGKTTTIKATVILSDGSKLSGDALKGMITWTKAAPRKYIKAVDLTAKRDVLTVTAKHGGYVTVNAKIDANRDGKADYVASATVNVKEYATGLEVAVPANTYVKHVINMNNYVTRTPATSNDRITWSVGELKNGAVVATKVATITDAGVLTLKKTSETPIVVTALSEKFATANAQFVVTAGNPAAKVVAVTPKDGKVNLEFKKDGVTPTMTVKVEAQDKDKKAIDTTDLIDWTVKNAKIATLKKTDSKYEVKIEAKAVGSTTVTAKATSGKKYTFKVKITAEAPEIVAITGDAKIYVGQKTNLSAILNPAQSTQKVKWTISGDKLGAKINNKGVLTAGKRDAGVIKVLASTGKRDTYSEKAYYVEVMPSTITKEQARSMKILTAKGEAPANPELIYVKKAKDYNTSIDKDAKEQVDWTASGKAATVTMFGTVKAVKPGTSNLKATVVATDGKAYNTTAKVKTRQAVTALEMAKAEVSVVPNATKAQDIKVKVKKQLPKTATKEVISWTIEGSNTITINTAKTNTDNANKSMTATVTVSKDAKVGDSVVLTATSRSGATASTVITVVNKTTKVVFAKKADASDAFKNVTIKVANKDDVFDMDDITAVISAAGANKEGNEKVTYTVTDKKGVLSVDADKCVYGLKVGTAKIKATTPSGKSATLTVKVVK